MNIETKYNYETKWQLTSEKDILKIIEDEIGDMDIHGTFLYIQEVIKKGKIIGIGDCKFRIKK